MTKDEMIKLLRTFGMSKRGCSACPHWNDCGTIGCKAATEIADALDANREAE